MWGIPNPFRDFLLVPGALIGVGYLARGLVDRWSSVDDEVTVSELPYSQEQMIARFYARAWENRHGGHPSYRDF